MNLHYVAGLFDGEGWFQIDRAPKPDRLPSFQVHARISLRQRRLLKALQRVFGGSLRRVSKATDKHAAYWSWDVCGENAAGFATRIEHLLILKNKQARLAVAFQKLKRQNKNQPYTTRRFVALQRMYLLMRKLNKKGPK